MPAIYSYGVRESMFVTFFIRFLQFSAVLKYMLLNPKGRFFTTLENNLSTKCLAIWCGAQPKGQLGFKPSPAMFNGLGQVTKLFQPHFLTKEMRKMSTKYSKHQQTTLNMAATLQ